MAGLSVSITRMCLSGYGIVSPPQIQKPSGGHCSWFERYRLSGLPTQSVGGIFMIPTAPQQPKKRPRCSDCGVELTRDEQKTGRDQCLECYIYHND
jgi:hypothetical protein